MKLIKEKLFRVFSYPFNNKLGQKFLFRIFQIVGYLLGYGCVDLINNSGELPVLKEIIKKSQNKDNTFRLIDVGVNLGDFIDYTISYSKKLNKKAQIDGFEPNIYCYKLLKNKYSKYNYVTINNSAISNSKKEKVLYYDSDYSGSSSLVEPSLIKGFKKMKIDTISLDECYNSDIDLLKVDVEGFELNVFKSAKNLISKGKIKNIMFEYGGQGVASRIFFSDIFEFFTENKYDLYRITPHGYLVKLNSWLPEYEFPKATNYLAKKPV